MEDTNTEATFTLEQVRELINTTVNTAIDGFRAKQNKEFQKWNETITKLSEGAPKPESKATDTDTAVMKRQIEELTAITKTAQERAAKAERSNVLNKALGSYVFVNDKARDVVFKTLESDLAMTSDGMYVIGDQPVDQAVKGHLEQLSGLLAPKPVSGTGAKSGNASVDVTPQSLFKPGMTKEEWTRAANQLVNGSDPGVSTNTQLR